MDVVLGLSLTPTTVRWVLVEGSTGEGGPIDRGARLVDETFDADGLLDDLLGGDADYQVDAVGVTWAREAEAAASAMLAALGARQLDSAVAISDVEAVEALAWGISDVAGYADVAVCVVEPDAAVLAVVDAGGVTVERIDRLGDADATEVTAAATASWESAVRQPEAVFVLGSGDLDPIVEELAAASDVPVISAAEADLAMARGAALAAATAVGTLDARAASAGLLRYSRTGALTSVLVAAVVTFVVSLAAAVGLQAVPDQPEQRDVVDAADRGAPQRQCRRRESRAGVAARRSAEARPTGPAGGAVHANHRPRSRRPVVLSPPQAPAQLPPPPAPVYVPPPVPVYVPPVAPPKPRSAIGSSRRSRSSTDSTSPSCPGWAPIRLQRPAVAWRAPLAASTTASGLRVVRRGRREVAHERFGATTRSRPPDHPCTS